MTETYTHLENAITIVIQRRIPSNSTIAQTTNTPTHNHIKNIHIQKALTPKTGAYTGTETFRESHAYECASAYTTAETETYTKERKTIHTAK